MTPTLEAITVGHGVDSREQYRHYQADRRSRMNLTPDRAVELTTRLPDQGFSFQRSHCQQAMTAGKDRHSMGRDGRTHFEDCTASRGFNSPTPCQDGAE